MRLYLRTKTKTQLGWRKNLKSLRLTEEDRLRRGRDTGRECLQGGQKLGEGRANCVNCVTVPLISGTEILGTSHVESEGF